MPERDMFSWHEKLYPDVEKSAAYSKYCGLVFGEDFSQQGFSDMEQIRFMLSKLNITAQCRVLDIGCATGKLGEYICDLSGANIVGLDYSPTAIRMAKERTKAKPNISFVCTSMDDLAYPANSFNVIYSIDAIFFSADLPSLLLKLNDMLKENGKFVTFYGGLRSNEKESIDALLPQNTQVGRAFDKAGLNCNVFDFTDNFYRHMVLKRKTAQVLKEEFMAEGNEYLFDYIFRESIPEDMRLSEFRKFHSRYMYLCEK